MRITILTVLALLSACATTPPPPPPTGVFVGYSLAEVQGRLSAICQDRGYDVLEADNVHVTCEKEASDGEDFMYRMMFVGTGGTPTVKRVRFSLAQVVEGVRVRGSMQAVSQQIHGQVHARDVTSINAATDIRAALVAAGAL